MVTVKKQERPKEDLKKKILEAARELFLKDGYEATSMRKIASVVGISPTAIYLYYKDKSDVMHALHSEGFQVLNQRFAVLAQVENAFERLKAMGRIYMHFAIENADYYKLMFIMKEPIDYLDNHCTDEEEWAEGSQSFNALCHTIEGCMQEGYFKGQDSKQAALLVWSSLHGLCALKLTGHLDHITRTKNIAADTESVLENAFHGLITVLSIK